MHSLILLLILFVFIGCSTTTSTRTGFLGNYSNFYPSKAYEGMLIDHAANKDIAEYQYFIIDPVLIYFTASSESVGVDRETLNELTLYFEEKLEDKLSKNYTVVTTPGPGVLRVRIAITDIVPNKPYLNAHWATKVTKAGIGGASIEVEFLDSQTNERIAAVIDDRQGRSIRYHKGMTKWGYTKDALLKWATMLANYLDEYNK
ncbi:MAG: hypothetical protein ACI9E5_000690 [Candidatus Omnitrophota bacterium]|jgi:hypothetical protein